MQRTITFVWALAAMFAASTLSSAQNEDATDNENVLLALLTEGPWPCAYYFLNSNEELNNLKAADWTGRCIAEDDWIQGYGPMSNSADQFLTTPWGSDRLPLLVRRHFSLTADEVAQLKSLPMHVLCSYDENPKVYLNGTLLFQKTGWNDNEYASYALTARNKLLLKEGDNVLAVSLMAGAGGGHIDYGLTYTGTLIPSGISSATQDMPTAADLQMYNLQGQKVAGGKHAPSKGIYIQNARKVVIK